MTTIWKSLSVANCPADIFFMLSGVSSLLALLQPLSVFNPEYFLSHVLSLADVDDKRPEPALTEIDG